VLRFIVWLASRLAFAWSALSCRRILTHWLDFFRQGKAGRPFVSDSFSETSLDGLLRDIFSHLTHGVGTGDLSIDHSG